LWQLYRHDLSEFRGSLPDAAGEYAPGRLPDYLHAHPDRRAYLVRSGHAPAGFALVRGLADGPRHMTEFFVVRALRRHGVGREVATRLLRSHPGSWEIAFQEENPAAARFWRRVAAEVARSPVREERRPVPGKPQLPPDTWLLLTV
jgi:predicted acetyltransferase